MSNPPASTTPVPPATLETEAPAGAPPVPFWKVLEEEFEALHPGKLNLDDEYRKTRDTAIAKAKAELKVKIQERVAAQGTTGVDLDAEVEQEVEREPRLLNGPACQELFQRLHRFVESQPQETAPQAALCLSGGGIRSATFALGVLQGLAGRGVLSGLDYLSTVSGGGYIGSWLSSWIQRNGQDSTGVFQALSVPEKPSRVPAQQTAVAAPVRDPKHPFMTEPSAIEHLRSYSNYLTPALGLLSGDGWAVAATVVRNLLLNWLLIIPALLCVLMSSRFALQCELAGGDEVGALHWLVLAVGFGSGVFALANLLARRGKTQARVLLSCVTPIVLFAACSTLAWFWNRSIDPGTGSFQAEPRHVGFYVGWGALTALLAFPLTLWMCRPRTAAARSAPDVAPPPAAAAAHHWFVRVIALMLVFALTGLAACWLADNAAGGLKNARQAQADGVTTDASPSASEWALIAQPKADSQLSRWVMLSPQQRQDLAADSPIDESPRHLTYDDLRLETAVYAIAFGFPLLLLLIFCANTVLTGVLSQKMQDEDREWLARASGWAFLLALAVCLVNLLVLCGPNWLVWLWDHSPKLLSTVFGGSALLTIGGGQSARSSATERPDEKPDLPTRILRTASAWAAPLFVVFLIMFASLATTLLLQKIMGLDANPRQHGAALLQAGFAPVLGVGLVMGLLAWGASYCVNINKFSLHAMYRNRLIRAYLGATNFRREPNPFTGFDPEDNLPLAELRRQRPLHVINTALNLVAGKDLAWQQRLAMSFTMTPYTCGSSSLGYRDSAGYARGGYGRGMTLGTALSLSGAAVSPNHGYNSTPLTAFLLTFFNARLGGWFGNPGLAGGETWTDASPRFAIAPLVAEAFGLTDADHEYVYLSDGGHFENLGLYEMVLRRCRTIIVSDAGCDPDYGFEDLGNAIAKIRVDFGIRIEFAPHIDIQKRPPEKVEIAGKHCAIGTIYYSDVDGGGEKRNGTLIYIKPAMCGNEPVDVYHYHREHPVFPHEPTSDQWFTESQFESYRTLGVHSIDEICHGAKVKNLAEFVAQVNKYA